MPALICNLPAYEVWVRKEYLLDHKGGHGEFVMKVLEWVGFIDEHWEKRREEREMEPYLIGLTKSQREIVIGEIKRNKIRLEEATRLRFEELSKNAVRPTDAYHNMLMNQLI